MKGQQTIVGMHATGDRGTRLLTAAFVLLLVFGVSLVKFAANRLVARQYGSELIGFYPSECAVQYRYARMIADGVPLPRRDEKLQYPEGADTRRDLTVFMEVVSGHAYRIARRIGFAGTLDEFLYVWSSFFSTLSVIPAYLLARRVFRSRLAGVAACLLYALSTASADRAIRSYLYETFALPFLFGGTACFISAIDGSRSARSWLMAVCAAVLLVIGLASWHFSRFYLLVLGLAAGAAFLAVSRRRLPLLLRATAVVTLCAGAAAVLVPVLEATRFWASPQLAVWLTVTVAAWLELRGQASEPSRISRDSARHRSNAFNRDPQGDSFNRDPQGSAWASRLRVVLSALPCGSRLNALACGSRRLATWVAVAVPLLVLSALLRTESEGYGHVWALLWEKFRHFGRKPADPAQLAFDARALWTGAFNSPSVAYVLTSFWAIAPACAVAAWRQVQHAGRSSIARPPASRPNLVLLLALAITFSGLFLFIKRLSVFAVFFLAVVGGGCVYRLRTRNRWSVAVVFLLAASLLTADFLSIVRGSAMRTRLFLAFGGPDYRAPVKTPEHDHRLVKWIRANTPHDAVFVARLGINPLVLAYADRAIVLQPKFEHGDIREKWREFLAALYGDESALVDFCEKYRVTHYLYDVRTTLDAGAESERYAAAVTRLPTSAPAYVMHFAPERLQRFELIYQNGFYRVYHFVPRRQSPSLATFDYQPLYDLGRFGRQTGHEPYFDDSFTQPFLRNQEILDRGWSLFTARHVLQALSCFNEVLGNDASFPGAHTCRGLALGMMGRPAEGLAETAEETRLYPNSAFAFHYLALMHHMAGNRAEALAALERCQQLDPDYPSLEKAFEALR